MNSTGRTGEEALNRRCLFVPVLVLLTMLAMACATENAGAGWRG